MASSSHGTPTPRPGEKRRRPASGAPPGEPPPDKRRHPLSAVRWVHAPAEGAEGPDGTVPCGQRVRDDADAELKKLPSKISVDGHAVGGIHPSFRHVLATRVATIYAKRNGYEVVLGRRGLECGLHGCVVPLLGGGPVARKVALKVTFPRSEGEARAFAAEYSLLRSLGRAEAVVPPGDGKGPKYLLRPREFIPEAVGLGYEAVTMHVDLAVDREDHVQELQLPAHALVAAMGWAGSKTLWTALEEDDPSSKDKDRARYAAAAEAAYLALAYAAGVFQGDGHGRNAMVIEPVMGAASPIRLIDFGQASCIPPDRLDHVRQQLLRGWTPAGGVQDAALDAMDELEAGLQRRRFGKLLPSSALMRALKWGVPPGLLAQAREKLWRHRLLAR